MSARSSVVGATALLLAVLTLTACGDGGSEEPAPAEPSSDATEATDATTATSEPTDGLPEDATPPGAELALGRPATVPAGPEDATAVVEIVVDTIRKGTAADLRALDLGEQAKGYLPYYIGYTVTAVRDGKALRNTSVDEAIVGILPNGSGAQALRVIGDWAPCDGVSAPRGFADGDSYSSCVPYLAKRSTEVDGAVYAPASGPYNSVDGAPVVWR
ncbi:hypothetical protein [Nocardioides sambongensis]|uniref:hypothetical protein n=1 Tax=Nocardioides sambongensis TaxID=2589074 RepID=UPI0011283B61|nr:hypothetical protein [Nocardioides sambongensis]